MSTVARSAAKKSTNVRAPGGLRRALVATLARLAPPLAVAWAIRGFCTPPPHGREPEPPAATARPLRIRLRGRALRAWTWGHGPTVLLVHGWGGRADQLAALAPPLVAAGFCVVAFDAPAHGASPGRRATLLDFRDAVAAVAARVGPLHGVIAHSLGAAATALAMRAGLRVERAVFVGPPADAVTYLRRFLAAVGIPAALAPRVEHRFEARAGFRWSDLSVPAVAPHLDTPLLVVHDRDDREVPWAEGAAIAAAWPGATLVTTEGLGHRRLLRDPEVIGRAVGFLGGASSARPDGRCATPGCGRPGVEPLADGALRCIPCAVERDLFDREGRWTRLFPPGHVAVR
jgi:pimeloyl-ACP methyl ester carboxylesterase